MEIPTLSDIEKAHDRIRSRIHRTPVLTNTGIDDITGSEIFFKCENFQKVGAFKFRGATNAVLSLTDEEAEKGVATHSSGNHAQALALAARDRGIKAHIVMPRTSPRVKIDAVRGYGAEITFCEPTLEARESTLNEVIGRTGAVFIHPYNNPRIIAGQATAAKELIEEIHDLDIIMTPVGGGGLLSGTALSTRYLSPGTAVIAAEPKGADDAFRSLEAGRVVPSVDPDTICDGLLTSLGSLTFEIIRENVDRIITVDDEIIIRAMRLHFERMKTVVEPSGSVPLAAILDNGELFRGKRIGVIISGGNVDLDRLPWS
ncbi:MAG: pyridoxal-phosphate dependent enzyme [Thermoplasmatota archaeon]